ncbi:MAG TPA: S41 family peptidase [Candidatus Acidoferrales bacterium]|nr:S41 family peptidase [Candidatus Acidoferrales bacterium]
MKTVFRILVLGVFALRLCRAQPEDTRLVDRLAQAQTESQALYDRHEFSQAAAVLKKLSADPAIVLLPAWPDTLYNLACDQSRAGQVEQAQATLQQAAQLGAAVSSDQLSQDPDLVSLHNQPAFQQLVETLRNQEGLWKETAALGTTYKLILSEDEKVAGLSKFWSETRFNFPFFTRIPGTDWDALYMAYLAKVRGAKTTADYYRVLMRFAAELKDGHTNIYPPPQLFNTIYAAPGLRTALVESSVVVTQVLDPNLRIAGWKVGDVILKVGSLDIREHAATNVMPYVSSSTAQDRDVRAYNYALFAGDIKDPLVLTVEDASGRREVRKIIRLSTETVGPMFKTAESEFRILPGSVAYVAVNEFEDDSGVKTIDAHWSEIQAAKGLVLDVRHNGGGNSQNGVSILQMLASSPFEWESEWTPDYKAVYRAYGLAQRPTALPKPAFRPDAQHHLGLPVVVLTSAETFSAAEDFVALFESMHRGLVVGEPTAGSTGQPFSFKLPGGGSARICTKETRTPDGRVYMGVGIQPQIIVKPSVANIREGSDAALDRAVEYLSRNSVSH